MTDLVRLGSAELTGVLVLGLLGTARLAPALLVSPIFGGRLVPPLVRLALALGLTLVLAPLLRAGLPAPETVTLPWLVLTAGKEALIGTAIGFLAGVPLWAAEAAGRLADGARGGPLGELQGGLGDGTTSPLGDLGLKLGLVLLVTSGGHLVFLRGLALSYEAFPLVGAPDPVRVALLGDAALGAATQLVLAALTLAAPVLAAMFVADLVLGLVGRIAPQLGVAPTVLPARALFGLLTLALGLSAIAATLRGQLAHTLRDLFSILGG